MNKTYYKIGPKILSKKAIELIAFDFEWMIYHYNTEDYVTFGLIKLTENEYTCINLEDDKLLSLIEPITEAITIGPQEVYNYLHDNNKYTESVCGQILSKWLELDPTTYALLSL